MNIMKRLFKAKKLPNDQEIKTRQVELAIVKAMQQHIYNYPHSYFIRKAPKHFNYKGR